MKKLLATIICILAGIMPSAAQSAYDQLKPFGFATRTSRTDASATYAVTGGGAYAYPVTGAQSVITLTSDGGDMRSRIESAVKNYSVIVFDGSGGDFVLSSYIQFSGMKNKTLLGINNARLCTQWYITQEIKDRMNAEGVPGMSTSGGGGTLVNGTSVAEQAEYNTRRILIEMTGDTKEGYRKAGIFAFGSCQNIIIRNLEFVGPGSIDVGGYDLLGFTKSKNMWVDHCDFTDGIDGNFDITQQSDFCTVSWCTFSYTDRSYMHQNTNLVGSSDSEATGSLNITFACNRWGEKCRARMPMARVGKLHMLNNYYDCAGNGSPCINPRKNSEFLVEGNFFAEGVTRVFSQSGAIAWTWAESNIIASGVAAPGSNGSVTVPYSYSVLEAAMVPEVVGTYAGATLFGNKEADPNERPDDPTPPGPEEPDDPTPDDPSPDDPAVEPAVQAENVYVVAEDETTYDGRVVERRDISMTYGNDGAWNAATYASLAPEGFTYRIAGSNNAKDSGGKNFSASGNLPVKGTYYVFQPTKDGTLNIAVAIFQGKALYVAEDGKAITVSVNGREMKPGGVANATDHTFGYITLDVKAGSTYYVFCESSKLMLFGFRFAPVPLPGDANDDGLVTMADANRVVNEYLGSDDSYINRVNADIDGDGEITMSDANGIANLYLSTLPAF